MQKPRTLAYQVATEVNIKELEQVVGGGKGGSITGGKVQLPTLRLTARAGIPDSVEDTLPV